MNAVPGYEMRIVRKHPEVDWQRVWRNIHTSGLPKSIVSTSVCSNPRHLPYSCSPRSNTPSTYNRMSEVSEPGYSNTQDHGLWRWTAPMDMDKTKTR